MENAVLHGKTTRHITVTLCRSGDWARFIVEDDGQGIAPDRLGAITNAERLPPEMDAEFFRSARAACGD